MTMTLPLEPTDHPAPRNQRVQLLAGLAIVVVLALVVATIVLGIKWRQSKNLDAARSDALTAARADAVLVASYDYRKLDDYFSSVQKIATGDFAKQYVKANKNLRGILTKTKAVVKASVVDAGVRSATTDSAVVVLFVDQAVENAATRGRATDRNRMRITLVRHDGHWLVSDLELN